MESRSRTKEWYFHKRDLRDHGNFASTAARTRLPIM